MEVLLPLGLWSGSGGGLGGVGEQVIILSQLVPDKEAPLEIGVMVIAPSLGWFGRGEESREKMGGEEMGGTEERRGGHLLRAGPPYKSPQW